MPYKIGPNGEGVPYFWFQQFVNYGAAPEVVGMSGEQDNVSKTRRRFSFPNFLKLDNTTSLKQAWNKNTTFDWWKPTVWHI